MGTLVRTGSLPPWNYGCSALSKHGSAKSRSARRPAPAVRPGLPPAGSGRAVSSDRIADAVWDGRPPSGVQTTLQTYVFHLRDALEPTRVKGAASGVIVTVPGGYRLDAAAVTIDALRFEELVAAGRSSVATDPASRRELLKTALGLWRGDVLSRPGVDERVPGAGGCSSGRVARCGHRAVGRGGDGARSRRARHARRPRREIPAARAPRRDADARALPGRPSGGRADRLPAAPADPRRRARDPAVGRGGVPAPAGAPAGPEPGPRPPVASGGDSRNHPATRIGRADRWETFSVAVAWLGSAVAAGRRSRPSCSWPSPPWWAPRSSLRRGLTPLPANSVGAIDALRTASATPSCSTARRPR